MKEKLAEFCKVCGCFPVISSTMVGYVATCEYCGQQTQTHNTLDEAIEDWNNENRRDEKNGQKADNRR